MLKLRTLLAAGVVLCLGGCAAVPTGKAAVAFFTVAAAGTAINVENSGNPVDDAGEAFDRISSDVKDGFGRDHFVGFEVNG